MFQPGPPAVDCRAELPGSAQGDEKASCPERRLTQDDPEKPKHETSSLRSHRLRSGRERLQPGDLGKRRFESGRNRPPTLLQVPLAALWGDLATEMEKELL